MLRRRDRPYPITYVEQWQGAFPLWLAPEQVRVLPVGEAHRAWGSEVASSLGRLRLRASLDASAAKLEKRIREAARAKVPYVVVVGAREAEARSVSLRRRGAPAKSPPEVLALDAFVVRLLDEVARKSA
jgi:threonyl-tRNA synthetase